MKIKLIDWTMLILAVIAAYVGKMDLAYFCLIFGKLCCMHDDIEKLKATEGKHL